MKKTLVIAILLVFCAVPAVPGCGKSNAPARPKSNDAELERQKQEEMERLKRAGRAYENNNEIARGRREKGDIEGAIQAFKEFPAEFNDTAYGEKVREEITKLENALIGQKEFEPFKEKLDDTIDAGNTKLDEGKNKEAEQYYKEAARMINDFEYKYGGAIYGTILERKRDEVRSLIEEAAKK